MKMVAVAGWIETDLCVGGGANRIEGVREMRIRKIKWKVIVQLWPNNGLRDPALLYIPFFPSKVHIFESLHSHRITRTRIRVSQPIVSTFQEGESIAKPRSMQDRIR
jgi:hypothetical protein